MYVVRYSTTIEADVKLGFSCFTGTVASTAYDALYEDGRDMNELESRFERFGGENETLEDYLKGIVEGETDMVYDERFNAYRRFHHSGLSCWTLSASSETDAMSEAAQMTPDFSDGFATVGSIRIVGQTSENVWVLECESAQKEV